MEELAELNQMQADETLLAEILESMREEGKRLLKRVGNRKDEQARKGLGAAGAALDALSNLVQEAAAAEDWGKDDWDAWVEDAQLAEDNYLNGWDLLEPEAPASNPLLGRGKWIGAPTPGSSLDSPLA